MSHALKSNIGLLAERAKILHKIRQFFSEQNTLEVETPLLASASITDPYLNPLSLIYDKQTYYLQTSPEYAMKRLLCAGSGSIYQICKAFRNDEKGRIHEPEFTMLEWYMVDFNYEDIINQTDQLLRYVLGCKPAQRFSYQELFIKYAGFDPLEISDDYLLDVTFNSKIEPNLDGVVIVYDYPASQAALSKSRGKVCDRFEVYINGIELANGYHELTDPKEHRIRFENDLKKRKELGYPLLPIDENFMSALEVGLPDCAGVALGVDRLVMAALKKNQISDAVALVVT
ncbi:MAG TPA: EF-P lysine aminoacylase GenX [Gammaproteobacteria bacterium]|nr:EF-P lysine aminoacylase GenX [Gammaproteobacteria bacterium]